ncbi:MAG: hypothetical protein LJE69_09600 [Thiohalocapsa sp.]|jgi:hypothetical protein|uniref:hypothetical protein n=1 Tax=Thiohalocapsa sp. TaxID=2497641 RepID=UPI0025FC1AEB|nr:hypothetical protein [Thiohalocapsa sp.]MCG6941491.1 hypothetical protein [Thiohalocapsa sp.]
MNASDMDGILEVEAFHQGREIIGVGILGIHGVAVPRLARAPMTATFVGDANA